MEISMQSYLHLSNRKKVESIVDKKPWLLGLSITAKYSRVILRVFYQYSVKRKT